MCEFVYGQSNTEFSTNSSGLVCDICPKNCILNENDVGKCQVISNRDGKLVNDYYGKCAYISMESIEKRPLFHYFPGSKFLSVSLLGCSFSCKFCQNYLVSQQIDAKTTYKSPQDLVNLQIDKKLKGIVFSFNEPIIHTDYICEVGKLTRVVIKTNGFATDKTIDKLCKNIDAFNVDIKGNESDYINICDGTLNPVLKSIENIYKSGKHLEISYLVLPDRIDDLIFHESIRDFISKLHINIPVHILYFYPFYKMSGDYYHPEKIVQIQKLFKKTLNYVYLSNMHNEIGDRNTTCVKCGKILVRRDRDVLINRTECCGIKVAGIF